MNYIMHKALISCALIPLLFHAAPSQAVDARDFSIANNTPWAIQSIYVKESGKSSWGSEVLGQNYTLKSGKITSLDFESVPGKSCMWDVRVVLNAETDLQWREVNICQLQRMTVDYDFVGKSYMAQWKNIP